MPVDPHRNATELLSRIRRLEEEGQVNEAMALARDASTTMPAAYDWSAELARLENEGKLARPYREGVEALGEGDYEDSQRLLSWVSGKNPRYREVSRYLYWATNGRDPETAAPDRDEAPPPSLLSSAPSPLTSPTTWVLALLLGAVGFGLGWSMKPETTSPSGVVAEAPAPAADPVVEEAVAPAPAADAPVAAAPVAAAPAAAPIANPSPSADASSSPKSASRPSGASKSSSDPSVSDVENPSLMSEADQLAINCQGGSAASCFKVGDSYYFGRGIARDLGAAVRYYTKACDLGEPRGCYNAADMVEKGESVPKDKQKAKTLFDRGCKLGDSQSCSRAEFIALETAEVP